MEPGCFGFRSRRAPVYGARGMVATSQPLASEAETPDRRSDWRRRGDEASTGTGTETSGPTRDGTRDRMWNFWVSSKSVWCFFAKILVLGVPKKKSGFR